MILDHPGQKRKLCLAAHHGNCTPPRISPSCPLRDRSTNAGAVIARQIVHDLLFGRLDPLPTLLAAFMQIPAQMDPRAPSNVAAHSLSLQGTPTDVFSFLDMYLRRFIKGFFGFRKSSSHHLSSSKSNLIAKSQKLPIISKNIFNFDKILIRRLYILFWLHPCFFAYSRSDLPSKYIA